MFANIAKDTKWNMTGDMLWGYFFTNPKRDSLDAAAKDSRTCGGYMLNASKLILSRACTNAILNLKHLRKNVI